RSLLRVGREFVHVPSRILLCLVEHSLRDHRTTAAFFIDKDDAIARSLQKTRSGDGDIRSVTIIERVVKQDYFALRPVSFRFVTAVPAFERFPGEHRQRPSAVDPDDNLYQP